jgi:hypothetical protein
VAYFLTAVPHPCPFMGKISSFYLSLDTKFSKNCTISFSVVIIAFFSVIPSPLPRHSRNGTLYAIVCFEKQILGEKDIYITTNHLLREKRNRQINHFLKYSCCDGALFWQKILIVGRDPKADSTRLILHQKAPMHQKTL